MRSFAKLGSIAAVATIGAVALVGCSSGGSAASAPKCAGTWTIAGMESDGQTVTEEDLKELADQGLDMAESFSLQLADDGKATMTVFDTPAEGEWAVDGDKCAITIQGQTVSSPIVDDKLVLEQDGSTVTFKRN